MPNKRRKTDATYQFSLPKQLHDQGKAKARTYGLSLRTVLLERYKQFVEEPIAETIEFLGRNGRQADNTTTRRKQHND